MVSLKVIGVVAFAFVAGVGAILNAIWGPRARARRRLARGSRVFVEGEVVTFVGKVRPLGKLLVAPLSGRACVAYEAVARMPVANAAPEMIHERAMTAFELETAEGPVLVEDAEAVELALPLIPCIPRRLEREVAFLESHDRPAHVAVAAGFDELIVEPGDRIAVQGMASIEQVHATAERGYRDAPTRVRVGPHAQRPLTIGRPR